MENSKLSTRTIENVLLGKAGAKNSYPINAIPSVSSPCPSIVAMISHRVWKKKRLLEKGSFQNSPFSRDCGGVTATPL